jgi:hypothetical protein
LHVLGDSGGHSEGEGEGEEEEKEKNKKKRRITRDEEEAVNGLWR